MLTCIYTNINLSIVFSNQSSHSHTPLGWSSSRSLGLSKGDTKNTYMIKDFIFLEGFLDYLGIHVIVTVPATLVYLENVISYIGIKIHLLSLENISFRSKFILTHTFKNSMVIIIQLLSVHFLTNQTIKYK